MKKLELWSGDRQTLVMKEDRWEKNNNYYYLMVAWRSCYALTIIQPSKQKTFQL